MIIAMSRFFFKGIAKLFSRVAMLLYLPASIAWVIQVLHILLSILVLLLFFIFAILIGA